MSLTGNQARADFITMVMLQTITAKNEISIKVVIF